MTLQGVATNLGDLFVASAVAGAIVVWSWLNLNRAIAAAFAVCCASTFGVVTLIKLWTSQNLPEPHDVALWALSAGAPSGHAAVACVVYGCAAALFLKTGRGALSGLGALSCGVAIALVCITRVTLQKHSAGDVVAGVMVAGVFVWLFTRVLAAQETRRAAPVMALGVSMAVMAGVALASHLRFSSYQFL